MTMRSMRAGLGGFLVVGAVACGGLGGGVAGAAPVGEPDPGVAFSSVVYGTGCLYSVTIAVNASGLVSLWDQPSGSAPRLVGSAWADGGLGVVRWVPRSVGRHTLVGTQNGVTGPKAVVVVHQGYGSGGACFAL